MSCWPAHLVVVLTPKHLPSHRGQRKPWSSETSALVASPPSIRKNGHIHNGKQHHQCKDCGRQFDEVTAYDVMPNAPPQPPNPILSGSVRAARGLRSGWRRLLGRLRHCLPICLQYLIHARLPAASLRAEPGQHLCIHSQGDLLLPHRQR